MEPTVRADERHTLKLADRPDGIEVSEQEDLRRTAAKLSQQMIPPVRSREPRDAPSQAFKPRGKLMSADVDGGLVRGGRFPPDERLNRLN